MRIPVETARKKFKDVNTKREKDTDTLMFSFQVIRDFRQKQKKDVARKEKI